MIKAVTNNLRIYSRRTLESRWSLLLLGDIVIYYIDSERVVSRLESLVKIQFI